MNDSMWVRIRWIIVSSVDCSWKITPARSRPVLSFIQCERAMVLLVHEGSQSTFSRVFDLDQTDLADSGNPVDLAAMLSGSSVTPGSSSGTGQSRFPVNVGITGYVATTGETVNIVDAYSDAYS